MCGFFICLVWFYVRFTSVLHWSALFCIFCVVLRLFYVCIPVNWGFLRRFSQLKKYTVVWFYLFFLYLRYSDLQFLNIFLCFDVFCLYSSDLRWSKDYITLICGDLLQNKNLGVTLIVESAESTESAPMQHTNTEAAVAPIAGCYSSLFSWVGLG